MNRPIFLLLLALLWGPFGSKAGEFIVVNEVITMTEASNGFHFWYDVNKGPADWTSPDDYYNGRFYCRFEVVEKPSNETCYLSFCIWGDPEPGRPGAGHPESASQLSEPLQGPGSLAVFDSSPSSWWKHPQHGGVNFAKPGKFWRWGFPLWASKDPHVLLAPKGWSTDSRSQTFWEQRAKWFPLKVRATVVAVSKGARFSGWDKYVPVRPETLPATSQTPVFAGTGPSHIKFKHFSIANPLPGAAWGTAGLPLVDLDGDGDLDTALSRRDAHGFWWYERKTDATWVQHLITDSKSFPQSLGATALDVNNDGWTDLVFSHVWFQNPGTLRQNPGDAWTPNPFPAAGHDLLAGDISKDGRQDIVVFDGNTLVWYNPALAMASNTVARKLGHHGGLTPKGVGDIDGDGDMDLVVAGSWFANPGNGEGLWASHTWPHLLIPNASYGTSIRSWVADLDADGDQDIVYSDCDTGFSHVYWVRNDGRGAEWTRFPLPDPPTSPGSVPGTGSFHSLGVADFDGDGLLDIFAGEQEDPDTYMTGQGKLPMKPKGLKERGVIWVQSPRAHAHPLAFAPVVIQEDNPGWHDASLGDVDGDGDIDIVSKVWNKDGPAYHADYWRNDTPRKTPRNATLPR